MIVFEYILVSLILALALTYLVKAFWPKSKQGGCGCGTTKPWVQFSLRGG